LEVGIRAQRVGFALRRPMAHPALTQRYFLASIRQGVVSASLVNKENRYPSARAGRNTNGKTMVPYSSAASASGREKAEGFASGPLILTADRLLNRLAFLWGLITTSRVSSARFICPAPLARILGASMYRMSMVPTPSSKSILPIRCGCPRQSAAYRIHLWSSG
jgi:hypothetical protein